MNRWLCGISLVAVVAYCDSVSAQETAGTTSRVEQVIVTGTRQAGTKAEDSAAPVQVVSSDALERVGQPNLVNALAQNAPSLQAQPGGSDLANLALQFRLRGLSPNHTLVLVDGKRRNTTAAVSIGIGPYQTGAATDLSFMPIDAIERVEVLQDGASAMYGTDAIAGVVNLILKKNDSGGSLNVTGGQYYKGDGTTAAVSFNIGLAPVEGAWFNLTAESRYHDHSFRNGLLPSVTGARANVFPTVQNLSSYPYVAISTGDPLFKANNLVSNFGYKLNDEITFYGSFTYGNKRAYSYQGFRTPNIAPSIYPNGFLPVENLAENDYEASFGVKGALNGWNYDLNSTYGADNISMRTQNTANQAVLLDQCAALRGSTCGVSTNGNTGAQSISATGNFAVPGTTFYNTYAGVLSNPLLVSGAQTNFYSGRLYNADWTNTLDISHDFDVGWASPLTLAFGGEFRHEFYEIRPGEPSSYYGTGSQGFPGYNPANSGKHDRDNYAAYIDLAVSPIDGLKLDLAGRHEHFSDFGNADIGKLTARYDFNPNFAVRGTINTGFRAPTLAEEYYSATSVSTSSATVVLPANSAAAKLLGISNLRPETTTEFSGGFVAKLLDNLVVTVDAYQIDIQDRIVGSGTVSGVNTSGGSTSNTAFQAITALGLQFNALSQVGVSSLYNGVNTRTRGVDVMATYVSDFGRYGTVEWNANATYNDTKIGNIFPNPPQLAGTLLLTPQATSSLVNAAPKYEIIAGANWNIGDFMFNLRETLYGPSFVYAGLNSTTIFKQGIELRPVTSVEAGYKLTDRLTVSLGAENLFDTYPNQLPTALNQYYTDQNSSSGAVPYPNKFSPFGFNGGYYYGKIKFRF